MVTRSVIQFYEKDKFMCAIYQQFDGYLSGVGKELKDFIKSKEWVNGYQNDNQFNGFGCFIARYILQFKSGTGGLYIVSKDEVSDYGYNYTVRFEDDQIDLSCDYQPEEDDEEDDIDEGYPYNEIIKLNDVNVATGEGDSE